MSIEAFWQAFLAEAGRDADTPVPEVFSFARSEEMANTLLALVLAGQKTATCSAFQGYGPGEALPRRGDEAIVTDWHGEPWCVIETTNVTLLSFAEVNSEMALLEGEDDTLAGWREHHEAFFREEGDSCGYVFSEDMPLVFEQFRVVYRRMR